MVVHFLMLFFRMQTLRRTNDTLETFNNFSLARYTENAKQVESYAKQLREMKEDLDIIFKRIR